MPPHLVAGLSTEAASHLCMDQCRGLCCRGALILQLTPDEVAPFQAHALHLGAAVDIELRPGGAGWVRFADHPGERCPMLDNDTTACRIYEDRPRRCRSFPETLVPGCIISGG